MQRRSFLKGVLGTSAVAAVPTIQGKELESLLVPDKEILLPTKFESIAHVTGFEPPFGVVAWQYRGSSGVQPWTDGGYPRDRAVSYVTIEAEFRSTDDLVSLQGMLANAPQVTWDLPLIGSACGGTKDAVRPDVARINGFLQSVDARQEIEAFASATIKVKLSVSNRGPYVQLAV